MRVEPGTSLHLKNLAVKIAHGFIDTRALNPKPPTS